MAMLDFAQIDKNLGVHAMGCGGWNLPGQRYLRQLVFLMACSSLTAFSQENAPPSAGIDPAAGSAGARLASSPAVRTPENSTDNDSSRIKLGPGDLVEINVYGVPELSTKARVSSAGDLYLPLVDYVHVGDLTLEEAQRLVERRLANGGFVKTPHVTIFIDEYASQAVTLLGEVARPGLYPIVGERRLFDVVSAAGGFTDKAGKTITITHRANAARPTSLRLAQHLEQGTADNVDVLPGDTIVVARAGIIYVVGDVGRPSGFLMESDSMTVLQAIAMAGGTNKTAKLNGARIIRKTPRGMQETALPLKKILQAKVSDLPLQADDILFVPSSARKTAMFRSADAVLQAATALTIVAAHP